RRADQRRRELAPAAHRRLQPHLRRGARRSRPRDLDDGPAWDDASPLAPPRGHAASACGPPGRVEEGRMAYRRAALVALIAVLIACGGKAEGKQPMVLISTSLGDIKVELYPDKAPVTVQNFLDYAKAGYYDGTTFHRVIPGFMIQCGGITADMKDKREGQKAPIKNESSNGLKNETGTLAMARTSAPDSATSQFFINVKDNG